MIIAKGQGNFESLSHQHGNLFFLFKIKCPLVANHIRQPVGTQVLVHCRECTSIPSSEA
jgi:damage-control phosphatase, subfamily I